MPLRGGHLERPDLAAVGVKLGVVDDAPPLVDLELVRAAVRGEQLEEALGRERPDVPFGFDVMPHREVPGGAGAERRAYEE